MHPWSRDERALMHPWSRDEHRSYVLLAAAAATIVVGWGVVATLRGWRPVGDDAFLVMRARDVFSSNPPLLSTASSGGASAGVEYNHPGPLVQYLNAPFVVLLGTSAAALANAVLNAACIGAVALLARLATRPAVAFPVLGAAVAVAATMGSEVLVDPWNPHVATLPFLVAAVAVWATWRGVPAGLPVGVLAASLTLQTHLSLATLSVTALAALALAGVAQRRRATSGADVRAWNLAWAAAALVGLASILPPLAEQLTNGSDGNVARLLRGGEFGESPTGAARTARLLVEVLAAPPWFLRGSWPGSIYEDQLLAPLSAAALGGAFAAVVVLTLWRARRRGDGDLVALVVTCVLLLVVGAATATRFPLRTGVPVPYFRWAWPLAALLWAAILARPVELLAARVAPWRTWAAAGGVLLVVLAVPYGSGSSASPPWAQELADSLLEQSSGTFDQIGPGESVRIEASIQEAALVLLPSGIEDLARRGIEVTMTDPVLVQQSGRFRRSDGTDDWVIVPVGPDTGEEAGPPDGRRIAWVRPLDEQEEAELDRDLARAVGMVERSTVRLGRHGIGLDATTGIPQLVELGRVAPVEFLSSRLLADALRHDLVRVDGADDAFLVDVSERAAARAGRSIALWLVPGG